MFEKRKQTRSQVFVNSRRTNRQSYSSLVSINDRRNTALVGVNIRFVTCLPALFPRQGVNGRYGDSHPISCALLLLLLLLKKATFICPRLFAFLPAFSGSRRLSDSRLLYLHQRAHNHGNLMMDRKRKENFDSVTAINVQAG